MQLSQSALPQQQKMPFQHPSAILTDLLYIPCVNREWVWSILKCEDQTTNMLVSHLVGVHHNQHFASLLEGNLLPVTFYFHRLNQQYLFDTLPLPSTLLSIWTSSHKNSACSRKREGNSKTPSSTSNTNLTSSSYIPPSTMFPPLLISNKFRSFLNWNPPLFQFGTSNRARSKLTQAIFIKWAWTGSL